MNTIASDTTYDVLCVGAHPDDVEMAMGGTVAGLVDAGHRVAVVVHTHGEMGTFGDAETRVREARAAAEVLGVDLRILEHPDGALRDTLGSRHEMVSILRELRPQLVFAPYPHARTGALDGRANVDHLACGIIVREATKLARFRRLMPEVEPHTVRRLFYYMLPDDVLPSFVVDVSDHRERLEAAISAYASQMQIRRGERRVLDMLLLLRQHAGLRIHAELGEGFVSVEPLSGPAESLMRI